MILLTKFPKFLREDKGVWDKTKLVASVFLLHVDYGVTHSVLARDFYGIGEMVDALVFVEPVVEVLVSAAPESHYVSVVGVGISKTLELEGGTD